MSKLVTLEQAKKLKELGFEKTFENVYFRNIHTGAVTHDGMSVHDVIRESLVDDYELCIYISEALDWFREVKGVLCSVDFDYDLQDEKKSWYYGCYLYDDEVMFVASFDTHSLAESALLDALIEYVSK